MKFMYQVKRMAAAAVSTATKAAFFAKDVITNTGLVCLFATGSLIALPMAARAQGTAFSYQGLLTDGNAPASGSYDVQFALFNADVGGYALTTAVEIDGLGVSNGLFTTTLDFGAGWFEGHARWIEISVRAGNTADAFTLLAPRQQVLPAPYAIFSAGVDAAGIVGTIPAASLAVGSVGSAQLAPASVGAVQIIDGSITVSSLATNLGVWDRAGADIAFVGGSVGIGLTSPSSMLHVNGTVTAVAFVGDGSGLTNLPLQPAALAVFAPGTPSVGAMKAALMKWYVGNTAYAVGANPSAIAFDGLNMWVANRGDNSVTKLRVTDGVVIGTYAVGLAPVALTFDGANIWVANQDESSVTKLRASDGAYFNGTLVNSSFVVDMAPCAITFDGANVWVVCSGYDGGTLVALRASDGAYAYGTLQDSMLGLTGSTPHGIAFDGVNLWVSASYIWNGGGIVDGVIKIRASDGEMVNIVPTGARPTGIAFDGANIWVSNSGTNEVTKLHATDGSLLGTFTVGNSPGHITFDGASIWVASETDNTVTKLSVSDGSYANDTLVDSTFPTGQSPSGVAFDGVSIWVANSLDNTVSKM